METNVPVPHKETIQTASGKLNDAMLLPSGARFYRCALQVNPFAYLSRYNKATSFCREEDYNQAIVDTCRENNIEVIGVTDHYRVEESVSLVQAARAAGIFAFTGFEAVSKDGVHFLCLFDPDRESTLERIIGECGVHDPSVPSPTGQLDGLELLERAAKQWGSVCIAAHVTQQQGGLLRKLSGQSRINVWTSQHLLACAIPGPVEDVPEDLKSILKNTGGEYRRNRSVAILNAGDVNSPEDLLDNGATCYVKMSTVSVEALRQAFLDPQSRIRLNSDPSPVPHAEFLAVAWEGGLLADTAVHFNPGLNVLVGGRGTGKSTLIESIRYALGLEPLGEDARKAHEGIVKHVLRSGSKVSILVRSHKPTQRCYTIERSVPNPPVVKDERGEVLALAPGDVMPGVEIFGQHEISELTKSREKLTLLLDRFVERDPAISGRKASLRLDLERSRGRIQDVRREMKLLDERLASLPGLEETHKRFQEAGLEDRLKEKSLVVREEKILASVSERLSPIRILHQELLDSLPLDTAFVSVKALEGLPNADILQQIGGLLDQVSAKLQETAAQLDAHLKYAQATRESIEAAWMVKRKSIEDNYERILRELQKSNIDGAEFIRLRQQIEELRPLRERKELLKRDLDSHETHRRNLLSEWEDIKAKEYREIERAAKKVSRNLKGRVKVEVTMAGNRDPFELLLREVGGNLSAALERLRSLDDLSLPVFAQSCREGKAALKQRYQLPDGAAERIATADPNLFMRVEELDLPATTKIELNTAPEGETPTWQTLEALSTGQKATAVLLLLLLESEAPLVVDQPEDDLDNRFITEGVVPIMRQEKKRRQFIFSTHNANIPVLGDAELILGLAYSGEGREGRAKIALEHMGSIDAAPVCELVEEILEGGKDAFETRRSKYGF